MSIEIRRHPDDATLMSYAAGSLNEALSAVVASHVAMCGACWRAVAEMELLGEALLAAPRLASPAGRLTPPKRPASGAADGWSRVVEDARLPAPIVRHYGLTSATIPWRLMGPGVWQHRLQTGEAGGDLRLLKISRGVRMPEHGHGGTELTLVLDGAFHDRTGTYARGDVQDVDEDVEHRPIADPEQGCICLIASESRVRFKGWLAGHVLPRLTGL